MHKWLTICMMRLWPWNSGHFSCYMRGRLVVRGDFLNTHKNNIREGCDRHWPVLRAPQRARAARTTYWWIYKKGFIKSSKLSRTTHAGQQGSSPSLWTLCRLSWEPDVWYLFIMYFSYLIGPPPTPVRASRARWVGVRVHVILLGMLGYVFYSDCTVYIVIQNKWIFEHKRLIILGLHWYTRETKAVI